MDNAKNFKTSEINLRNDLKNIKDSISQTATHAKDKASDALEHSLKGAKEKGAELQENVVGYVKANPVKSVGIAALVGFVTALILRK